MPPKPSTVVLLDEHPDHVDAAHLLGVLLHRAHRSADAIPLLERVVSLVPDQAEAVLHLGSAYQGADLLLEAERAYRRCIAIASDLISAHVSLGILLKQQGRLDESRAALETALQLQPGAAEVWHNLGNLQRDLGDEAGACKSFERALDIDPEFLEARYSRALALLGSGDLDQGWEAHEMRLSLPRRAADLRPFAHPYWQGENLSGRTLLVWGEQGIGDEMFHAGMYQELLDAEVRCVFECSAKLVPLFECSFPGATVVPRTRPAHPATLDGVDAQVPAGSLGRYLRRSLARFPRRTAYLRPILGSPRTYWQRTSRGARSRAESWLLLAFQRHSRRACARMHGPGSVGCIAAYPPVHWICLQYDECRDELEASQRAGTTSRCIASISTTSMIWTEVSALTAALDLVISAPTAVSVHAAALGIDVWQLTYGADWQTHGTSGVPWYPGMTRYVRGAGMSRGLSVLDRVETALKERMSRGDPQ